MPEVVGFRTEVMGLKMLLTAIPNSHHRKSIFQTHRYRLLGHKRPIYPNSRISNNEISNSKLSISKPIWNQEFTSNIVKPKKKAILNMLDIWNQEF